MADFAHDHPNIALVFSFGTEDNLMHPWKADPKAEKQRIKTGLLPADAPYFDFVAGRYREVHGGKDAPRSGAGKGSFLRWAYFHFGRWSFAARGWWVPKVKPEPKPGGKGEEKEAAEEEPGEGAGKKEEAAAGAGEGAEQKEEAAAEAGGPRAGRKKPGQKPEPRGEAELNALRWFEREGIEGFVDWVAVSHPDFEGRKVEVGGIKPFLLLNPPASLLGELADKHFRFLAGLVDLLPEVRIERVQVDSLGEGLRRLTVTVVNRGYLPTLP
ncbi:MAG: hypothetical protein ACE5JG_07395 [Planctomycetota bacterium]